MKKALLGVLVFVVLCVIVGFWTLKDFDQKLRSEIITLVSEKTGRSLVIDGETKTHFSLFPSITINDVKLTNASWAEDPYMLEISNLSVEAELMPLFSRQVKIKRFVLDGVRLNLEINPEGKDNWTFPGKKTGSVKNSEKVEEPKTEGSQKDIFGFAVSDFVMQNVSAVLIDRQKDKMFNAGLNTLNMQSNESDMTLTSQWTVEGQDFLLSAKADSLGSFFAAQKPYQFTAEISNSKINIKTKGEIIQKQLTASVSAELDDLSVLSSAVGYELPAVSPANVTAQLSGPIDKITVPSFEVTVGSSDTFLAKAQGNISSIVPLVMNIQANIDAPEMQKIYGLPALPATKMSFQAVIEEGIELENLNIKVGQSDLSGRVLIHTDQNLAVYANLHSAVTDLSELLGATSPQIKKVPSLGNTVSSPSTSLTDEQRMFSDKPLPFHSLMASNINVTASIDKLIAADKTDLGKINLTALMQNGKFTLSNLSFANYLSAKAVLNVADKAATIQTDIKFNKMPLPLFFAKKGVDRGTLTGSVRLNSKGVSPSTLAGALNGQVFLNFKDVNMNSFRLIDFPPELEFLSPPDKAKPVTVSCAVINLPIKNGVINSQKSIGLESNLITLQVNGNVNLGTEKIDMKVLVSPVSEGILETVFNSVFVGGTLSEPSVRVNAEQTFDRALSLGMAFFMGGKEGAKEFMRQETLKNVCSDALVTGK